MLIRFDVTNYKVFRDTTRLSMEASKDRKLPENIFQPDGCKTPLLKLSATYGANASGKTSLFSALQLYINFIRASASHADNIRLNYQPYAFGDGKNEPTSMEAEFIADGIRYVYGFSYDTARVTEEHLYSYPKGKRNVIVQRTGDDFEFKSDVRFRKENARRVRPTTLFVSVCAQFNDRDCVNVFKWASEYVFALIGLETGPSLDVLTNAIASDKEFRALAQKAFRIADLGIIDVRDRNKAATPEVSQNGTVMLMPQDIWVKHEYNGKQKEIPLVYESAGTVRFLTIIAPGIITLKRGGVLLFDEMDLSFHTDLCRWIAGLFLDPNENPHNSQLILNTHDVSLFDQSIIRRDQINIVSKDSKTGAAELRRLSDFSIRNDLDIRKAYLNGSFGGRPFISPDKLMDEEG